MFVGVDSSEQHPVDALVREAVGFAVGDGEWDARYDSSCRLARSELRIWGPSPTRQRGLESSLTGRLHSVSVVGGCPAGSDSTIPADVFGLS